MKKHNLQVLVPGVFAALALAVTVGAGAQTPPTAEPPSATTSTQAAPMPGHEKHTAAKTAPVADMKAECQAMMAKMQTMHDTIKANDAALDELVTKMNAAKGSKETDAMEAPMAAVITELVAQSKSSHSMAMEMQPQMMAHMMRHMEMHATDSAMECPMMKMDMAHDTKPAETEPKT
jgi:hypothetical protein